MEIIINHINSYLITDVGLFELGITGLRAQLVQQLGADQNLTSSHLVVRFLAILFPPF